MSVRKIAACLGLLIAVLHWPVRAQSIAQPNAASDGLEIRGTVIQPAAASGGTVVLGGVEITLTGFPTVNSVVTPTVFATATTDGQGAFRFRPQRLGNYMIDVKLDGYVPGQIPGLPYTGTTAYVTLTRENSIAETRFVLTRRAEITGRVLDEAGNPVSALPLRLYNRGAVQTVNSITTREDGTFTAPNLQPGQYVVGTLSKAGAPAATAQFTEKDIDTVDSDFEPTYWPGVPDMQSATVWTASPGASTNLPDLHLRKVPTYRARISVKAEKIQACTDAEHPEKEQWTLMIQKAQHNSGVSPGPQDAAVSKVACGKDLLVRNLRPGEYLFALWSGKREGGDAWASQQVEVKDKNISTAMEMSGGVNLDGRVVAAEGAKLPSFDKLLVINAASMISSLAIGSNTRVPDASGRFVLANLPSGGRVQIEPYITNRTGYYVQAIRFNGQLGADGGFDLPAGSTGAVEIVIDDKPASVTASVLDGDKPYLQGVVALLKWPMLPGTNANSNNRVTWSGAEQAASSQVQVSGLAPGEYRAFAIRREDRPKLQDPTTLERIASRGEKVTLERGASQNVTLKLTDPSR